MEILLSSTEETKNLARKVAKNLEAGDVLALYGELGSGKTTFTRYLVDALKITAKVQSPTFVLMRKYSGGAGEIKTMNHIDLYRITSKEGVEELGLEEIFEEKDAVSVIEWPELIEEILPKDAKRIKFTYEGENERKADIQNLH